MTRKPLKTELHHWWPRTLSEHWSAPDGMVSVIRPSGEVRRAPPGAFGAITNAHHIRIGGPWDSTFEPLFNQPDDEILSLVCWLATLEASTVSADKPLIERIMPQPLPTDRLDQIARVTASLLARSPSIRNLIKIGAEQFRVGLPDPTADKTLIALNQRGLYDAYRKQMTSSGRWAILFSDESEFVAGDGFLHNFPASREGMYSGAKLVLPILPTATIVYMLPAQYPSEPRLVTLRVSAAEVTLLNGIVQVYANKFLFFRSEEPTLTDDFKLGRHRIFQYHGHDWLDPLLDSLSQYNLWGKDGAAGMCRNQHYAGNLKGNRWLERFTT